MDTTQVIPTLVALAAIGTFVFGVIEYRKAQLWKRLEYAANQLQRLQSDPDLTLAMIFLDISERGVPLPEKYWDYYSGKHVFNHNCQAMYQVMATAYDNTPEYFIYVDVFERLFSYLEQIAAFIEMGLIKASDVKSLTWILEDLAKPQWTTDNRVFIGRISLSFSDIFHLMDIFGIEHAKKMSKEEVVAMDQEYNRAGLDRRAG